jgi:hypothetical protein
MRAKLNKAKRDPKQTLVARRTLSGSSEPKPTKQKKENGRAQDKAPPANVSNVSRTARRSPQ